MIDAEVPVVKKKVEITIRKVKNDSSLAESFAEVPEKLITPSNIEDHDNSNLDSVKDLK